ncbi:MAG: DUF1501 domain-containing protein [Gemmataceae bacterium]|nr:DUF1501 domain-containing protein [Gemmataceae bacterium]
MLDRVSRRRFLQLSSLGLFGPSLSGWLAPLAARAAESKLRTKSCILLWMDGGPSHKDTFDLKPGTKDAGEFQPIATSVPGIQISEHLPETAKVMHHGVIIRSMSTGEGAHGRAKYYLHTGYREGQGGLVHPSLGAIVSKELGRDDFPLPNFVTIGNRSYGAGFLGPKHQPLTVSDPARGVESLKAAVGGSRFDQRLGLLEEMEAGFYRQYRSAAAFDHHTTYRRAVRLMQSKEVQAFDLSREPEQYRRPYGSGKFADGCLLARRLVEVGVPFVEVHLGGWDTHQNNFSRVKALSQQIDQPMSTLVRDLKDRGLLDSTLVIWMGEFGRTPKINTRGTEPGRDHYPRAWSLVLFGGGIKTGQVIGKTDAEGATVEDRPVSAIDFLATVCRVLGIDYTQQNESSIGRPIRIVDKGANPIRELF